MSTDDRILSAALEVFLEEGPRAATTRRIATLAGVNEVTLFRRFGTKEDLLLAAMRRDAANAAISLPCPSVDPEAELVAWTRATARRLSRHRGVIQAAIERFSENQELCARSQEGPAKIRQQLAAWFEDLRARGRASGDWQPRTVANLLMGALFGEIMRPDAPETPIPSELDAVAAEYARLTLQAIGALKIHQGST
jgi:AcrR family transcriptional regulator